MASVQLQDKLKKYIKILLKKFKKNRLPATAIGAEFFSIQKTDFSGPAPDVNSISPKLNTSLVGIGGIGNRVNGNTIGCCCEVRSANKILGAKKHLEPTDVKFTKAIRPRTGQHILRCQNCIQVFGNE